MNKFKLGEVVKITSDLDMTATGGPFIPRGTRALIMRRRRDGQSCWVNVYGYGQRELPVSDLKSGNA